jgi:hypothetical protein
MPAQGKKFRAAVAKVDLLQFSGEQSGSYPANLSN